jgi:hypothetical protein
MLCWRLRACLALVVLPALVLATGSAPPRDGALQPDPSLKLVITPTFGQCFSNGTTTFRANAPVTWQLFPMDGAVPYTATRATPTSLTLRAGRHGGRMLVVATASGCAAGSACAEQLGSPSCAGVAAGETTLAQVGVNLCSAAFANASWTVVPWWKVRRRRGLQAGGPVERRAGSGGVWEGAASPFCASALPGPPAQRSPLLTSRLRRSSRRWWASR